MKLPNGDRVEISMEKLIGHCLNLNHSKGENKARVFQSRLGITAANADRLRALIQQAAIEGDVVEQNATEFGQVFKVDWAISDTAGLQLRTTWEITASSNHPRLITAFIKR